MTMKISLPAELMTAANDLVIGGTNGVPTRLPSIASRFLGTDTNGNISWTTVPVDPSATTTALGTVSIDALPTSGNPIAITLAGYLASITGLTTTNFSASAGITSGQITSLAGSKLTGTGSIPPITLANTASVTNGQVLTWNTGGTLSWTTPSGGSATSIDGGTF